MRCPTCAGQVLVPDHDESSTEQGPEDANPFVFDRNDFDGLLQGEVAAKVASEPVVAGNGTDPRAIPAANVPAGAWGTHAEPSYRERLQAPKPAPQNGQIVHAPVGVYLSRNQLILAGVLAAVAIVIAFGIGLTIGIMLGTPEKNAAALLAPGHSSAIYHV